ncbi:hypothetical protein NT6N_01340 [Oceaniferula spumae]|uniref:Ice-binding protein C-terminal domain-containing protein n=1 Tax=Oceaniferula spumae TaxID=2979115 RepID=A0AAT9FGI7_9BACT
MKLFCIAIAVGLSIGPVYSSIVTVQLSSDSISGGVQFSGTQSWSTENNQFYADVVDNGFDFTLSYDTEASPFNVSGSLGTQFNAMIVAGSIGSRDVSTIANLSGIVSIMSISGSQPRTVLLFTAREKPFGDLANGYNWNDVNFAMTDSDRTLSLSTLPDSGELLLAIDSSAATVRNSRGGNILASREAGSQPGDGAAFDVVPEPSSMMLSMLGSLALVTRRRR